GEWARRVDFRPGIYVHPVRTPTLPPATHTNVVFVGDGRDLVAIDPASPYPEEQAALDELVSDFESEGRRLAAILLTHRHVDHVSGAEHLAARTGAPILAHRDVRDALRGTVSVTRTLEDGETIDLSADGPAPSGRMRPAKARRLRAVLTPGHAVGHLAFLEETSGSVVAGDLVAGFGWIIIDPPEGDMAVYLRSLERLKSLGARLVYPAHGPPITDASRKVDEYVGHRLAREAKVLAAAREGRSRLLAIVEAAYTDTPPALHGLASRSALAHLIKLEAEGALPAGFAATAQKSS
ncbi:MBL fold metallo-hydrolase, partial [bacterium]|nr:MBL fold metallo-hydrolase [bacterium]